MTGSQRLKATMTAIEPSPRASAVGLVSPSSTPCRNARASWMTLSPDTENPNSLGSWPTMTVSAMPCR